MISGRRVSNGTFKAVGIPMNPPAARTEDHPKAKGADKNKQQEPDKAMVSYFGCGNGLESFFKRN